MNSDLVDLQLRINISVHEIHQLTQDIRDIDNIIIDADAGIMSEDEAHERMNEVIEQYKNTVDKTKTLLECYFATESEVGVPTDFLFRRLYRKLQDAY